MKENLSKSESVTFSAKEEHLLDWNEVMKNLRMTLGKDVYESWIKNINLKKEFNHYVLLSAPTRFVRDWIVSRYADKVLDIIKKFKKTIQRIEFFVEETEEGIARKEDRKDNKILPIENSLLNYNLFNSANSFDNFVVGESNELAYVAAQKVCSQSSHYNPLFIYSSVGMGKTHLLNAIGLEIQNKKKVMFISAERFMYHFIRSIKSKSMVQFKDFFRTANVFIIDDIQFVGGKEAMQEEFFHTFNALMDRGSQIVISSDRAPSNLDRIQERIKSRLSGGLVIDIQPPDLNLKIKILKRKLEEIKKNFSETYDLSDEILNYLASEVPSSIREMVGALNRILAFSKINTKPPNIYECKKILKDFVTYNNKSISIESIQNIVAAHYNLNINEMLSPRRSRSLARPRQIAMYLAKQNTTKSLPEIGRNFSNRDHTTVIHAVKKIEELIKKDNEIKHNINEIKKKFL
ncbi:MAG TPA: chromosomal replication initiator protein DnaA [Candidatus Pelagibacter sp.]|jgi:chromosomal replication initiator protein|nr:chromosomal replication initiator protein DnaA [Candidatus Pelagibacter sp.]